MFSVLLSVYFKEKSRYLEESLYSLVNQTLMPSEIVIVEDGPLTNDLYKVLTFFEKKYGFIKRIPLKKNVGLGAALNEGLKYCTYELVARMDSDDISYNTRFEKQIKFMIDHPDIGICSAWINEFIDSTDNIVSIRKLPESHEEIVRYSKRRCPFNHPVVVFRKSAVISAGGYQHFPLFEDYYLWARMIMDGVKTYNIQESLLFFRFSPEMIKRRGGGEHAKNELRLQRAFYKIGFINYFEFIFNCFCRFSVRIVPNQFRLLIYKFIRKI